MRNPVAVVVWAHLTTLRTAHDDEARRPAQVWLVKGLYQRGYSAEQVRQLYRPMERMMALPKPLAELAWNEIHEFEKEKGMTFITTAERVGMEKGLAEGLAKGRQKGIDEGIEKGIEKGREEGLLEGIEALLKTRLGAAGLALMPEIRQVQDAALLRQILASIKHPDAPEAVRKVWAKR
jgi:flagellar biosynthesis/type III secretory pathway protein FliH